MFQCELPRSVKNGSKPKVHQNTKIATVITVVLEALFHESASFRVHPYAHHVLTEPSKSPVFSWAIGPIEKIYEDGLKVYSLCARMVVHQQGLDRWKIFTYNKSI